MSKKKVTKVCKLQFQAGGAKPGPALASAGINMPQFCTAFNDATRDQKVVAGTITVDQLKEIAEYKMPDLNANDVEAAMRIVAGTARNMGIKVEGFE